MREIKFRGYAVEKMVNGQWLYGSGVGCIEYAEHYAKEIGRDKDWHLYTESGAIQVHEKSIGQYTGLKDKNGKEIYEGDVVESVTLINGYICNGIVIFENGKFLVDIKQAPFSRDGFKSEFDERIRKYTVIGNIYENPELLEGGE